MTKSAQHLGDSANIDQVTEIEWLALPKLKGQKLSRTDMDKRNEIFLEFLYYTIDSLLIPLIRSNFYVTESNVHRHRLFYFRHDIWRYVAEPAMAALKAKIFEEVKLEEALQILNSRQLGFSQVRLLPKDTTMRPITNLRRRTVPIGNTKILGPSINAILGPVHTVLTAEKVRDPLLQFWKSFWMLRKYIRTSTRSGWEQPYSLLATYTNASRASSKACRTRGRSSTLPRSTCRPPSTRSRSRP